MTSELRVTTIANNAGSESVDTTYVVNGSAKHWTHFDQSNSNTVRDSFNQSSATDVSTGNYYFSFSSSMANKYFSSPFMSERYRSRFNGGTTSSTTSRTDTCEGANSSNNNDDTEHCSLATFGDLA